MTTDEIIKIAIKYIDQAQMMSSAVLCLEDAVNLKSTNEKYARKRALKCLAYSLGVYCPVYQSIAQIVGKE